MDGIASVLELLNVQQAAELLGVNPGTIRRWAQSEELKGFKVGSRGDWRFTRASVLQMVKDHRSTPAPVARSRPPGLLVEASDSRDYDHLVQFYENEPFLIDSVQQFVNSGLQGKESCVLIATKDHIARIEDRLQAGGMDLEDKRASGQYIALDAAAVLEEFMVDGLPSTARFFSTVGNRIAKASAQGRPVRAFGEMVAVLLAQGNTEGALRLEELWNDLAKAYAFSLLCAYPIHLFNTSEHAAFLMRIGRQHSQVMPAESYMSLQDPQERSLAIVLLQQKAQSLITEIAERKQTERALRLSEVRFKRLFEAAADGILIIDAKTYKVLDTNPLAANLLGHSRKSLVGKGVFSALPVRQRKTWRAKLEQLASTKIIRHELRLQTSAGGLCDIEIVASLYDEDARAIIQMNIRDITERKNARQLAAKNVVLIAERQQLMQLSSTKDEFISLASHQLRTPATVVKQYLGMVLEGYAGPPTTEQKQFLHQAYESNERQLNTISDLLQIAQIDSNKMALERSKCNVMALVTSIVKDQQASIENRRQKIVVQRQGKTQDVWADAGQLRMVLENLIDNASKYSFEGTTITVTIRSTVTHLTIAVADRGVGIARHDTGKLFQKFSRIGNPLSISVGGNGLGLYIADKIIRAHGGSIDVTSSIQKGSTFTVKLPLHKTGAPVV